MCSAVLHYDKAKRRSRTKPQEEATRRTGRSGGLLRARLGAPLSREWRRPPHERRYVCSCQKDPVICIHGPHSAVSGGWSGGGKVLGDGAMRSVGNIYRIRTGDADDGSGGSDRIRRGRGGGREPGHDDTGMVFPHGPHGPDGKVIIRCPYGDQRRRGGPGPWPRQRACDSCCPYRCTNCSPTPSSSHR